MTPKDQAEALALKCSDEIGGASTYIADAGTIKEICCLVEFFEVVEWSNNLVNNCATELDANCCEQNTRNALAALHDALKQRGMEL